MSTILETLRRVFGRSQRRDEPTAGAEPTATPTTLPPPTAPLTAPSPAAPPAAGAPPVPVISSTSAPAVAVPNAATDTASSTAQAPVETKTSAEPHDAQDDTQASAEPAATAPAVQEIVVGPVGQTKVIAHTPEEGATPVTLDMPSAPDIPPSTAATDAFATTHPAEPSTELPTEPLSSESQNDHPLPEASTQATLPQPAPDLPEPPPQSSDSTTLSTTGSPGSEEDSGHEPET